MSNVSFLFTCLISDKWKKGHQGVLEKIKVKQRRTTDLKGPWGCVCGALLLHDHRCLNCQNVFHLPARKSRGEWSISFRCDYLIDFDGLPPWFPAISLNLEAMLAIAPPPRRLVNWQIRGVVLASAPFSSSKLWEDLLRRCSSGWPAAFQEKVCAFRCITYLLGQIVKPRLNKSATEHWLHWNIYTMSQKFEHTLLLKVFPFILIMIDI